MTTKITGDNITDGSVTTDDLNAAARSSGATDGNAFNIGVLGFKIAVNEGLTIFNLVDGIVDEFNNESGIDTAENVTSPYDSSSDFYSNLDGPNPIPSPTATLTQITSSGAGTFSNEPTTTVVKVFALAGGGAGGGGGYGSGGGGSGATGGGGGFTGIFDGEVTIIEGGTYNEGGAWQTPGTPNNYPDEGPGFADTVSPTNAAESVLIVGSGGSGENSNGAPLAQAGGGGFTAGTNGSGTFSVPTAGSGGTNASGGGADQEANGHLGAYPFGEGSGFGPAEWTQESPHPDAIHFQGSGFGYPPYNYGGGGSGYHGGGGTSDPGGYTGGSGGGAGYSNPTYVPTPSLEYEAAVGSASLPSPSSVFDEAPYYTALPSPRQALFADGARGEGAAAGTTNFGGDGGILLVFDAGSQATSMTLVSDTFTATSTPTTSRIVVFAELPDGLSDFTVSVTRDNSTFDTVTLTDTGYVAGSSGTKIFTGTRTLTGTASPQVQMRWKVVGSSLSGVNKIHGVALQWA